MRFWNFNLRRLGLKEPDGRKVRALAVILAAGLVMLLALHTPEARPTAAPAQRPGTSRPAAVAPLSAPAPVTGPNETGLGPEAASDPVAAQEAALARSLTEILSRVAGVGRVYVAVALACSEETRFAADRTTSHTTTTERGGSGQATRDTTQDSVQERVVLARADSASSDRPVTTQVLRPEVRGVLVVATGAAQPVVRAEIAQAVAAAAGVPIYRVVVLPAAQGG